MENEEKNDDIIQCYNCDHTLHLTDGSKVYREDNCEKCNASLHCCKMCVYFDTNSYNECREPIAQRILDKEKSNFCDNYKLIASGDPKQKQQDHLSAANSLFKD